MQMTFFRNENNISTWNIKIIRIVKKNFVNRTIVFVFVKLFKLFSNIVWIVLKFNDIVALIIDFKFIFIFLNNVNINDFFVNIFVNNFFNNAYWNFIFDKLTFSKLTKDKSIFEVFFWHNEKSQLKTNTKILKISIKKQSLKKQKAKLKQLIYKNNEYCNEHWYNKLLNV